MAAKKLRFLWNNYFDAATVTAKSAAADYPVSNLQLRWKTSDWAWRSVGVAAGEWVIADLGVDWATKPVQAFVLENMNFTAGMTIELGGNAADPTAEEHTTYELVITVTTAMAAAKRVVVFLAAAETYRWWRFKMSAGGGGLTYLEVSRPYLGPYFEPARAQKTKWKQWTETDTTIDKAESGQVTVLVRPDFEVYELPVTIVGSADKIAYKAINTTVGKKLPLWICLDSTDEINTTVYCHFLEKIPIDSVIDGIRWETVLKFEEEL